MSDIDGILGYHLNPFTCGVAKFNSILARKLNVPFVSVLSGEARRFMNPLVSLKLSELEAGDAARLERWLTGIPPGFSFRLFVHAWSEDPLEVRLVRDAAVVYCGNSELAHRLRHVRSDLVELWCPGTIVDCPDFTETELSVFSFGMAHKFQVAYYEKLEALLRATGKSYSFYFSTALHDGESFEDSIAALFDRISSTFGDNAYFLGYLSDSAVRRYIERTTYFASFFDKGVRANNTSINAALHYGAVAITNVDRHSPRFLVHDDNIIDIEQCTRLPVGPDEIARLSARAMDTSRTQLGWPRFLQALR